MDNIKNIIEKFEADNNFKFLANLEARNGFELIKGFFDSFKNYEIEINRINNEYIDFFNGTGYNKIVSEYTRVQWNVAWFMEIVCNIKQKINNDLSNEEINAFSNFLVEILDTQRKCLVFFKSHFNDFKLYNSYFLRFELDFGFNKEDYITFEEYKANYDEIERLERETFINWVKAQRICGKIK